MAKQLDGIKKLVASNDSKLTSVRSTLQQNPDEFDKTVVRISAANLVGLDALRAVITNLLAATDISGSVAKVRGPEVGKLFRLRFTNEQPGTAGTCAPIQLLGGTHF